MDEKTVSKHGGPAFPVSIPSAAPEYMPARDGMTLRDWFAGQVAPAINPREVQGYQLTAWFGKHRTGITDAEMIAAASYEIADAMLARRSK